MTARDPLVIARARELHELMMVVERGEMTYDEAFGPPVDLEALRGG